MEVGLGKQVWTWDSAPKQLVPQCLMECMCGVLDDYDKGEIANMRRHDTLAQAPCVQGSGAQSYAAYLSYGGLLR